MTDKSEEPIGDIEMKDESSPTLPPGAAAQSHNGDREMQISTVPDQDIRPEPVAEETKEQAVAEAMKEQ